jgi:hypothetical protein
MNINSSKEFKALLKKKGYKIRDGSNGWIRISCPTCTEHDKKKLKRYVNPAVAYSHCFICEKKLLLNDILDEQLQFTGVPDSGEEYEHPQAKEIPANVIIPIFELPIEHQAKQFLLKDHISNFDELWDNFGVFYIPIGGAKEINFDSGAVILPEDSLIFPIVFEGQFVGWQCRFLPNTPNGEKYAKMKYFHIYNKGKYLYNFDTARKSPFVVVFEGIKKCWKYPIAGVSTSGKGITTTQMHLLQNNWKKIIFFMDSNAQEEADVNSTILRLNGRDTININPADYGFKDPDEMTHEQVRQVIESKL